MPAQSLIDRYRVQLQRLLPPGPAFNRRAGSFLSKWLEAFGVEFARVHDRALDLYTESYPGDASEILTDWEGLVGLPDECTYLLTAEADRQAAVLSRFSVSEGQSEADFKSIAADFGYTIDVGLYDIWRAGSARAGHTPIQGTRWQYASKMSYEAADPADPDADAALACNLNAHKHAHTQINFNLWDDAPVASLNGLRKHFVHGDFVESNGVITEWTNRENPLTAGWVQSIQPDSETSQPLSIGGFTGASGWDIALDNELQLQGLTCKATPDGSTLIHIDDYTLFMAVTLSELPLTGDVYDLIVESGQTFEVTVVPNAGDPQLSVRRGSGGGDLFQDDLLGLTFVLTFADSGTNAHLRVNQEAVVSAAVSASQITEFALLTLGNSSAPIFHSSYKGAIHEIIACDYIGIPGSDAAVDAVTDYLVAKYL